MYELRKVYYMTENEAMESLRIMLDVACKRGFVHVSDYYDIGSNTTNYGSDGLEYGWTEDLMRQAHLSRDYKFGWYIKLPNPIKLGENDKPKSESSESNILTITIHTNELENPAETLADIFKHIPDIKDRMINITIM